LIPVSSVAGDEQLPATCFYTLNAKHATLNAQRQTLNAERRSLLSQNGCFNFRAMRFAFSIRR